MSKPATPAAFPDLPPQGHRPRFGADARVPLASMTVDPTTRARFTGWKGLLGWSAGKTMDALVAHAMATNFLARTGHASPQKAPVPEFTPTTGATNTSERNVRRRRSAVKS